VYLGYYGNIYFFTGFQSSPHSGQAAADYKEVVGDYVVSYSMGEMQGGNWLERQKLAARSQLLKY